MKHVATIAELFAHQLDAQPDAVLYRYLLDGDPNGRVVEYSFAETYARSAAVAAMLTAHGLQGRRVLLLHRPGLGYISAFFGCLLARAIAVPAYPPDSLRLAQTLPRIISIAGAARVAAVLTGEDTYAAARHALGDVPALGEALWINSELPCSQDTDLRWLSPPQPDSTAYLQFTSGSTSDPKGVMISHANIMHNSRVIHEKFQTTRDTRGLIWLPPYHDMGLVGGVIQPLYYGGSVTLMSPLEFIKRPMRWLEAIAKFRATLSGGPDFAYELCARKSPSFRTDLDLSCWRLAFTGAEPVRAQTMDSFAKAFARYGFDRRIFYPCYGLAEATLFVTGGANGSAAMDVALDRAELARGQAITSAEESRSIRTVSCGQPTHDHTVLVVDPVAAQAVPHGTVGEIWISGPSVAQGYWDRPDLTAQIFRAQLSDDASLKPFLRTGDLGCILEGTLHVVGRLKDTIILRGLNHYPQDIEETVAASHSALRANCCAAFSIVGEGSEALGIAVELRNVGEHERGEIITAIRAAVATVHDLVVEQIFLLPPRALPKTASGKLMRATCRDGIAAGSIAVAARWMLQAETQTAPLADMPDIDLPQRPRGVSLSGAEVRKWLIQQIARRTGRSAADIDPSRPLQEYGLDSKDVVEISGDLQDLLHRPVPATLIWQYPTVDAIAKHLADSDKPDTSQVPPESRAEVAGLTEPVAIIGIGCRFPGSVTDPESLWRLLDHGGNAVTQVPRSRWDIETWFSPDPNAAGKMTTRWGGFVEGIEQFDAEFFHVSGREAVSLDPRQRLLLEVTWEALERANLATQALSGSATGVFVGLSGNDYYQRVKDADVVDDRYAVTGNVASVAAGRLAYFLGLSGPAIAIDTACSSSLVAVHLACQSLCAGDCTLAIAGGVNLVLAPEASMYFSSMHAMSPTGRSAAFDASADGYVRSDGCGVVILKRLSAALRDADPIVAVIRGSAINHDGRSNGLTAPNGLAQEAVIRKALERGGVRPEQVSYVEAHGTGTPLGDPIEAQALGAAFAAPGRDALRIGSVKTNIGHTEAAAGIAGLIKVALALEAQRLPASIHYRTPNSNIDWKRLNLSVVTESTAWPRRAAPRFAGVSSFGFSGTNAHVVLEEAPARSDCAAAAADSGDTPQLIALSAHTPVSLRALAGQLANYLGAHPDKSAYDVAFTLGAGRRHFRHRAAFVASTMPEIRQRLEHHSTTTGYPQGKIAFVFSGQGSQYVGMGRELAARWPTFSATLEQCDLIFSATSGLKRSLRQVMWAEMGSEDAALLQRTEYTQAALFCLEYALFRLWSFLGVVPDLVVGHSIGEIVAACAAGVFSMEEALRLCIARGRLIGELAQEGAMAAVVAEEAVVVESIAPFRGDIEIAAVNSPSQTVISGHRSAITAASALLVSRGIRVVSLNVSHAFHSSLLSPALEPLRSVAQGLRYRHPSLAMVSTVTGARAGAELANAGFWVDQVRKPVLFRQAAEAMAREGVQACFELGPDAVLLPHVATIATHTPLSLYPTLRRGHGEVATFLEAVAGCYRMGGDLNWRALWPTRAAYVSLPTYPWQRTSYWPISEAKLHTTNPHHPASAPPLQASDDPVTPQPDAAAGSTREAIASRLREFLAMQLRISPAAVSTQVPFVEMGADSIVFLEAAHMIEKSFGLTLATHQLFGELNTIDALATFIEHKRDAETPVRAAATVRPSPKKEDEPVAAAGSPVHNSALKAVIDEQLRLMSRQLDLLASQAAPQPAPIEATKSSPEPGNTGLNGSEAGASDQAVAIVSTTETTHVARQLSPQQKTHIDSFAASYVARTPGSRQHALSSRRVLADRRTVAGFTVETKELQYPIVGATSAGSRLRDVDGNEYIDVSMGFGVHLFGHQPEFIRRALERQLAQGFQIGPQPLLAGKVAQAIVDCTHLDRATFCNSGTEAVMTALRLARATTGRSKILLFKGSYHGHFDGTLALARHDTQTRAIPMAPGVTQGAVEDVIFGEYGDTAALEIVDRLGAELAAVLVEPVQSRRPELQPRAFLHELRALTRRHGIALIFDEVITGFRLARGGAQELFGVEADLATYGKLLGGGMPIGVVAGREQYMDRIDGGRWTYGDHSAPSVPTTFFAGTFSKHPLTMAASLEVLEQLTRRGAALYAHLDGLTAQLANRLNTFFEEDAVPLRVARCGSIFRIAPAGALSSVSYLHEPLDLSLFYYHMIHRGVYFWEGRTGFLSDAHTEADITAVADAVESSVAALRAGGFLRATSRAGVSLAIGAPETRRRAPLSWGQEGIWFFSQLNGENGAYNMHGGVRLTGALRIDAVEATLVEIFRRHDVLRTTFRATPEGTEQIVAPVADVKLDLARRRVATSSSDAQHELRLIVDQEARRPFDLAKGPLLRFVLVEFSPHDWVLLVTMHHIVGDGWSLGLLVREFSQVYQARSSGRSLPLSPLRVQYVDYAAQERHRLQGETLDSLLQYWREQLEGAPTALSLPKDRPRSEQPNYQSATYSSAIAPEIVERVRSLGRTLGTTLYMTLLSAFGLLLHRLTAQTDLLVGSIVANRPRAQLRDVIGLFANTIVLRLRSGDDELTFRAYLERVREVTVQAYAHQDAPFNEVVKAVNPPRNGGRHPFFQVWFNMEADQDRRAFELPGLTVAPLEVIEAPTEMDISLSIQDQGGGRLLTNWIYNEQIFERARIEILAEQFAGILQQITTDATQLLSAYSLVTSKDQERLPDIRMPLARPVYPAATQLFLERGKLEAERTAVVQGDRSWSYADLRARSLAIASALRGRSAEARDAVAVSGPPSFGLVASIIGTLISGRVLLTVDPALPARRKDLMYREARARDFICVGVPANLSNDVDSVGLLAVGPQTGLIEGATEADGRAAEFAGVDGPAYIFYTSGSTGSPKGILGTRQGIDHFVAWQRKTFDIRPADRISQLTRLSFDAILRELFLPLTSGSTLCLPDPESGQSTLEWLEAQRVTVLHAVPSLIEHWLAEKTPPRLRRLRLTFLSGEPLTAALIKRWRLVAPDSEIVNFYGPTETTMIKCYYRVPSDLTDGMQPVGHALPDTQALVLGAHGQLCGVGEPGEIALRTPFRTLGYINAPAEQQARFRPAPTQAEPDDLVYHTGDRGRYQIDGNLEVLGRFDRQIKIRGVRIEPGEIEAVLLTHPGVQRAVVLGVSDAASMQRMVAFIVASGLAPSAQELRAFVLERVPEPMVPNEFVLIDSIPLNANGKTDNAALQERLGAKRAKGLIVAPTTDLQRLLLERFKSLLGVEEIGVEDDFFARGGHSLLAAQLVARLRRELGVEVPLSLLFQTPTVAGVSSYLEESMEPDGRALLEQRRSISERPLEVIEL